MPRSRDEIEIQSGHENPRWETMTERVGQSAMGLILVAALLGLMGHGMLSSGIARAPDGLLTVEYHRFERYQGPSELRVSLAGPVPTGELRFWVSQSLLDDVELQSITPAPLRMEAGQGRTNLVFAQSAEGNPAPSFRIGFDPMKRAGLTDIAIGTGTGEPARFWIFTFP